MIRVAGVQVLMLLALMAEICHAQQDPQFTHYMFNQLYFNPAYAGIEKGARFTALHRSQWLGYESTFDAGGAPSTQLISFTMPLAPIRGGIGGYIVNDRLGPLTNLEIQTTVAHHFRLKEGRLSLGVRAGMFSQSIDFNQWRFIDKDDKKLIDREGKQSQFLPDLALGAYYHREKFFLGLSVTHLLPGEFDFGGTSSLSSLDPHLYLTGGYWYELNFDVKVLFSGLVKSDLVKTSYEAGGIAYFKNTLWGGISFRPSEAAILLLGYSFLKDKNMRLGYALDYVVNDRVAKQPTSHEFILMYNMPVSSGVRKIQRTPRFRKD